MLLETIMIALIFFSPTGLSPLFGCPFQSNSTKIFSYNLKDCILLKYIISQPLYHNTHRLSRNIGLGSSPFAHHYKGNHFVFFSLRYLDVSVHAVRLIIIYIQIMIPQVHPRWVASFGNLRIKAWLTAPRSLWQSSASFIASWCHRHPPNALFN